MVRRKAATLKDVAQQAGVSVVAASRILNGSQTGTRVSEATRERILAAAAELDYHPNVVAQGLRKRRVHAIGVLFCTVPPPVTVNPFAAAILEGILAECAEHGYHTLIYNPNPKTKGALPLSDALRGQRTDGVLLVVPPLDSNIVDEVVRLRLPTAVLSAPTSVPGVPWIEVDNVQGARLVAEHFLELGHRRIAHICTWPHQASPTERKTAFWARLAEAGIYENPNYSAVFEDGCYGQPQWMEEHLRRLLNTPEPPTAIFATNDEVALSILNLLQRWNIRVPEQISLVGFDDVPATTLVSPSLTTVANPMHDIAREGVRQLIAQIEGRTHLTEGMRVRARLVVRDSTGKAPD
jgi:DNA-binding LacI/PurR family transcriptional regulator